MEQQFTMGKKESDINEALGVIKVALLSLKASGADGFEGMLRLALTKLTGIPFRLAASGMQGGVDGDAAIPSDSVSFEAKRYSEKIGRETVLTKIADLARRESAADRLWVLGATTEVSAQLASAVKHDGDACAVSTLILDWSPFPLPLLAVAVVACKDKAINFLITHFDESAKQEKLCRDNLVAAFHAVSEHPEFENLLRSLRTNLSVPILAFARAIEINNQWQKETFSSAYRARERLGQALSVIEDPNLPEMRIELRERIAGELQAGNDIILSGNEGHGKSWLAAQVCSQVVGMALFISAERFDGIAVDSLDEFLIGLLIKQSGEVDDHALKVRWRHRFKAWRDAPPLASLLVIVDGVNQRQSIRWDRLLNVLQSRLQEVGGNLVVTARPQFWRKTVARGLAFKPTVIDIPEWLPKERDELLNHYGVKLDWLDADTLHMLQNPRLLSIAVTTLPRHAASSWKGLTTDRLLMEHLRASQLENFEDETFGALTDRLSKHATAVLSHVQVTPNELPKSFQMDSNAVIETRFFRPLPGPGDCYELRDEGLTLALGFTLVDQLWQAYRAERDLTERMVQLMDPIRAMDRTADVLFASLLVCALDDIRFANSIFVSLLDAFANLQNVNDQRFEEFVEIIKHQPEVFFGVLKGLCLERGRRINHDWFFHASFEIASTDLGWQAADTAIHQWLHCYNKDPVEQINRYPKHNNPNDDELFKKKSDEINEVLLCLSTYERHLLEKMSEVQGEPDELFTLALKLLAGRPLASFANSFVSMGIAFALNRSLYSSRKAFQQLTTFNRTDRVASRDAFLNAIAPLRTESTSQSAQWTVVRMLYATGDELAAVEASALSKELRKNWYRVEPASSGKWRHIKVANPESVRPVDMDTGLQYFTALEPDKMLQTMSVGREDYDYRDFLPVVCRFEPKVAYEKARSILSGLLTRTEFPLRQAILNSEDHIPLIGSDLASQLIRRVAESGAIDTLPEKDRLICRMFAFYCVAAHLSAEAQLDCMMNMSFGSGYLLAVIPSLKPQSIESVISFIQEALDKGDESMVFGALVITRFGNVRITPKLEGLILRCCSIESSKIRAVSYELAACCDLECVRQAHVQSEWTAESIAERTSESWFGSILLIEACANGELPVDELLKRVSQEAWFVGAGRLGSVFTKALAEYFLRCLHGAIEATRKILPPTVDFTFLGVEHAAYSLLSIEETDREEERFPKQKSLEDAFLIDDSFDEKRDILRVARDSFFQELKGSDAKLLVRSITIEELQYLVDAVPPLLPKLVDIVEKAREPQFVWLKNLVFAVGNLVSKSAPKKAVSLFYRAMASQGFVTQALGDDLTLEHSAIWSSEISEPMKALWHQRLLSSWTDAVLAREILAAERFGATAFIKALVLELAASQDSLNQAYAISFAGYSSQSIELIEIVTKHVDDKGITGDSAKHALASHETAQWAEYWIDKMWCAPTSEEFWQCLMIAKTCMDARVDVTPKTGSIWTQYAPLFRSVRKAAIKEQNKQRDKRFLGQEAPDKIFVAT
ncbi:hypothetical protein [Vreelandella glaciei]|uniref:hypothetical protein n=1 Tax=Vreelandella glaciei TaxID=186761 RepID=UPI0030033A5D